jgi:hypothetical protein
LRYSISFEPCDDRLVIWGLRSPSLEDDFIVKFERNNVVPVDRLPASADYVQSIHFVKLRHCRMLREEVAVIAEFKEVMAVGFETDYIGLIVTDLELNFSQALR